MTDYSPALIILRKVLKQDSAQNAPDAGRWN